MVAVKAMMWWRRAMNEISGKVVAKESGLGIPRLLVVVFHTDPGTTPEELIK
jgi:hypothetical protein